MLVVTPFHPGDADQALRLFQWVADLDTPFSHDLLLIADTRCAPEVTDQIRLAACQRFRRVEVLQFTDHFKTWPEAPNAVFGFTARHIMANQKTPWFFLEPDCCPLTAGWLDAIEAEYQRAAKPFLGAHVLVEGVPEHMSGNAVYPANLMDHAGYALIANDIAWDVAAADQIVPQAHFTKLIEHSWKRDHETKQPLNVSFESWEQVEREISKEAVIYHANKDGSLIARLRERKMNLSGSDLIAGNRDAAPTELINRKGGLVEEVGSGSDSPIRNDEQTSATRRESGHDVTGLAAQFICDVLIKSYPPDYERLSYCLRSIDKFATGFRRVVVVIPKEPDVLGFGMGMSDPDCRTVRIEEQGDGYLFQQAVKANAHQYTDADFVLHIDSDTILTKPVTPETFMRDGKPLWLITPYAHLQTHIEELSRANAGFHCGVMTWKPITEKFLGQPVEFEFMRRFPMLLPRSLHVAAAGFCQVWHGKSLAEYILSQPAKEFSEFNALGALAYYRANEEFSWLDTTKEPLPELVAIQKWSHEPLTDEVKAEFEDILKGGDAACTPRSETLLEVSTRRSNAVPTSEPERAAENPNIKQTPQGFWVLVNDSHISRWCEEHGSLQHDFHTLPKVLEEIQPGDTVIDVGANIGDTTEPFRQRVGLDGRVIAFEPNPDACECLARNCQHTSLTNAPEIYNVALGASATIAELAPNDNAGARHLRVGEGDNADIIIATLDSFRFDRCDFIKIDVEGYELNVLRGAEQTINRFHPKMLIELNEGALQRQGTSQLEVCAWLAAHGYQWWPVQANVAPDSPQYDVLCKYVGGLMAECKPVAEVPKIAPPWQSPLESINEVRSLANELKKFCTSPAHINKVRQELHSAGVIQMVKKKRRKARAAQ